MARHPSVEDLVRTFDAWYPPQWAESWDAVGLVCGDPADTVERVQFTVDVTPAVVEEAVNLGAQLIVAHHPLLLRPVHGVPATSPKGRLVHRMIREGVALFVAHTNADVADPGVSDAFADALGLTGLRPLAPSAPDPLDKIVTFVPHSQADAVIDALAAAGAGAIGQYERCAFAAAGRGTFLPLEGADPAIGRVGAVESVEESRVEMVLPRARRRDVVAALWASHPYEEPAFDVYELANPPRGRGLGRIGELRRPESFSEFVERVARALPATEAGVRAGGDPNRPVRSVAVCGGAGDGQLGAARSHRVDAYVTADLRHHPASEELLHEQLAIIDVGHWASEWPWLGHVAQRLAARLRSDGTTVETHVSTLVTDPWTLHRSGQRSSPSTFDQSGSRP